MDFVRFIERSHERSPLSALLILFGYLCLGFVIASVIQGGILALVMVMNASGEVDLEALGGGMHSLMTSEAGWWWLVIMQGLSSVVLFILTALAYWSWVEHKKLQDFNSRTVPPIGLFLFVFLLQISFMPFNALVGSINENIVLPEALAGVEKAMKEMERSAAEITEYLAKTNTVPQLLMNILVIGIIAGIGEELIFRGIVMRKLLIGMKNPHAAVWISAIIFSAIHFQFYGFFPRMFLGALFGYLYLWTGNILVPIAAHVFNNTLAVILYYLIQKGVISPEMEKMDAIPLPWVVASTLLFIALLYPFYRKTREGANAQA